MSLLGGEGKLWVKSDTGDGGLRITSNAWPEARLFIGFTCMSVNQTITIRTPAKSMSYDAMYQSNNHCWWVYLQGRQNIHRGQIYKILKELSRTFKLLLELVAWLGVEAGADEGEDGQLLHLLFISCGNTNKASWFYYLFMKASKRGNECSGKVYSQNK